MNAESIIFDMDGTLWDSSENVAASWSETIRSSGDPLLRNKTITGSDLRSVMGMTMVEIAAKLFPELTETRRIDILEKCGENEKNYLAANGGELYPQLEETLSALSKNYRLFIVSNCQNGYIEAFFEYYSLERYFTDYLCWGDTHKPKSETLKLIMQKNHCGVLTIILLPLFFLNEKIRFRQKMGLGAVLMTILLSMYLSTVDLAWHGFQVPNWLPYRYSFTFSFILLVMAAMTFERLSGITLKEIGCVCVGLCIYAFYIGRQDFDGVTLLLTVWYTVIFTVIYSIILRFVKLSDRKRRSVLTFIIGIFVIGELFGTSLSTMEAINSDVVYSKYRISLR